MNFDTPPWLVDFLEGISLWDAIIWAIAVFMIVLFIKRKGWRWIIKFARAILSTAELIDSVKDLPEFIARTDSTLAAQDKRIGEIHHETHTNNGTSIKDSSQRTEEAVQRIENGVTGLYTRTDELEQRIGSVDLKIVQLTAADQALRDDLEDTKNPRED